MKSRFILIEHRYAMAIITLELIVMLFDKF
jgi:hypothetical protein